jgi:hypothetical protein
MPFLIGLSSISYLYINDIINLMFGYKVNIFIIIRIGDNALGLRAAGCRRYAEIT